MKDITIEVKKLLVKYKLESSSLNDERLHDSKYATGANMAYDQVIKDLEAILQDDLDTKIGGSY